MMSRTTFLALGLLFSIEIAVASPDASFPCRTAKLPIEKSICANPELADLDRSVAEAFKSAAVGYAKVEVLASQRRWLSDRTRVCRVEGPSAAACLVAEYKNRLSVLRALDIASSTIATCEAVAALVREGKPFAASAKDPENDTNHRPIVVGTTSSVSARLKSELYRFLDERTGTSHVLEQGETIDIGVPSNLIAIKSDDLGTLQCDTLDLFRRLPDQTLEAVGPPADENPAAGFGCTALGLGRDRSGRPMAMSTSGNAAAISWQFTPWLGSTWGGSCHVRASYQVDLVADGASCRVGVDCAALAQEALTWAKAWEALGFQHDEPRRFGGLAEKQGAGSPSEASELPNFGQDATNAFDHFAPDTPIYTGASVIGPVDVKFSYPRFGDRAEDAIIVGVFREDGEALAGFEFRRHPSSRPTNVMVDRR